jgi:glycosyltransferase involved in cell wall biosynthesis
MSNRVRSLSVFMPNFESGGAQRVMVNMINGFVNRGLDVKVVVPNGNGAYRHSVDHKVSVVDLKTVRVSRSLVALVRYLRKEEPAMLLTTLYYASVLGIVARYFAGTRTKVFVRVESTLSVRLSEEKGIVASIHKILVKSFLQKADAVIAVSYGVAEDLVRFFRVPSSKVSTIYHSPYPENIDALAAEIPQDIWFSGTDPIILAVGRLDKVKDYAVLLHAFALLVEETPARLMILGEGPERRSLESLISQLNLTERVKLSGFDVNPFKYMRGASVFVLSSRYEGLPGVLIQAMRCGCPVVSTDCKSGPSEILEKGKYGPLVPVGRPELLAEAIVQTLKKPLGRNILVARAKEFSMDQSMDRYMTLFRQFVPGMEG